MGNSLNTALQAAKNLLQLDAIISKFGSLVNLLPAPVLELYKGHTVIFLLALSCFLALLAFEGYKIFKMLLYAGGAAGLGIIGYWYVAPIIPDAIKALVPPTVEFNAFVAILFAFIAIFICKIAQPLMIMVLGGICGYFVGSTFVYTLLIDSFNTLDFLRTDAVKHIVGGAIASVMVLIFLLFFKHIYIVATSFGGTIISALLIQFILIPTADESMKICFIILAIALGIFALAHQYQEEEKALELIF